jgi:hypothetical protein
VWLSPKDIDSDGFLRPYYVMRNTRDVVYEVKEKHFSAQAAWRSRDSPLIVNLPFC